MKKIKYRLSGALIGTLRKIKFSRKYVTAIILAAGSGTRMGKSETKQWLMLENAPVFVHSLKAFDECKGIKELILCVKADEYERYADVKNTYRLKKPLKIVTGGSTRAESAFKSFKCISDKTTHVAFHDAARCLITPEMIEKVLSEAIRHGAATAACKATDTVKLCDKNGFILSTPERSCVWQAQTPQIFETEIYRASVYLALKENTAVTDDCSLAEKAGFKVKTVDCGKENLKITEPVDLHFASAILKARKAENSYE